MGDAGLKGGTQNARSEGCWEGVLSQAVGPPSHPTCIVVLEEGVTAGLACAGEAGLVLARPPMRDETFRTLSVSIEAPR